MPSYILEVVEFLTEREGESGRMTQNGKYKHIGYMKGRFRTKNDAVSYYDRHNSHMRSLNAHGNYKSDWDPETKLLYIVREDHLLIATIDCFDPRDNPTQENSSNSIISASKWLK